MIPFILEAMNLASLSPSPFGQGWGEALKKTATGGVMLLWLQPLICCLRESFPYFVSISSFMSMNCLLAS